MNTIRNRRATAWWAPFSVLCALALALLAPRGAGLEALLEVGDEAVLACFGVAVEAAEVADHLLDLASVDRCQLCGVLAVLAHEEVSGHDGVVSEEQDIDQEED
eukprot:6629046-Alexandrium_andersonii.AAC.1